MYGIQPTWTDCNVKLFNYIRRTYSIIKRIILKEIYKTMSGERQRSASITEHTLPDGKLISKQTKKQTKSVA
jgi:hypothetical protein